MTVITASQQTRFESMVTSLAATRRIPRAYAIEILVAQLGGGAEKLS